MTTDDAVATSGLSETILFCAVWSLEFLRLCLSHVVVVVAAAAAAAAAVSVPIVDGLAIKPCKEKYRMVLKAGAI